MSHTPLYDAKIKVILDVTKPGERVCALTGEKWMMTEEEIGWYKKFNVPPADVSPLARMEIVTSFYVGYQWWTQMHPETGKPIITAVHPATGLRVLPDVEWHAKDFAECSREYDLEKPLFPQMRELQLQVPLPASRNVKEPENSICLASLGDRNSYFTLLTSSEDSLYVVWSEGIKHSALVNSSVNVSESYYVNNSINIFGSFFVNASKDIMSSSFVFFSDDLEYCFGASDQKHKKYLWFDEQLSKEEWTRRYAEVDLRCRGSYDKWVEQWRDYLRTKAVWPENLNAHTENCIGEYVYGSRDLQYVYDASHDSHDMLWAAHVVRSSAAAFSGVIVDSEDVYASSNTSNSRNIRFSHAAYYCQNVEYCFNCYNCENCFGCFGLNRKSFHIFNKKYSEEEYWNRLDGLKVSMLAQGEYGRFFPLSMSPSYFGQSGAVINYGTDPAKGPKLGGLDYGPETAGAIGDLEHASLTDSREVPECIDDVSDSWINKPLLDKEHGRRFVMIKPELQFYRDKRYPAPTDHFVHRVIDLMHESNIGVYEERSCEKCGKKITVAKNRKYNDRHVYCKDCYFAYIETR